MPRLQALLECVGQALCEKGRKALRGQWPFADILHDYAKAAYDLAHQRLPGPDLRAALHDAAGCPDHEYQRRIGELIADLSQTHSVPKEGLTDYMRALPPTVRQHLRRPSDPGGCTAPEKLTLYTSADLLPYLPPRIPRFRTGDKPADLDGWVLAELRGFGECSEVWRAEHPDDPARPPAALKFAIDPEARDRVRAGTDPFTQVFPLNQQAGVLPLRAVFLESDPPCLEAPFVYGYDLAGLMLEWKWRYDGAKPEAALKLMRRLAAIVGEAHARGVVHRDLKPANVLLHPTDGGKFTMWVSDFGWGQIQAARSLELARGGARGEQQRLAHRGAATSLYASPQQAKKEPPAPADDVHALGVVWFQLLKRDPAAAAPVGTEWMEEFRTHGFTDSQARVLQMCLATRPDRRPRDARHLAELLAQVTVGATPAAAPDGSRLISIKGLSSTGMPPLPAAPIVATGRGGKPFDPDAGAAAAAALLSAVAGPGAGGGPLTTNTQKVAKNSVGMTFVKVAPGGFRMGSPASEPGHREHEGPLHDVRIGKGFYLAAFPVTQAHYEIVVSKNPAKFARGKGGGPDHPVEGVSWKEAEAFCRLLADLPEEAAHSRSYRLPTEAEWEYACRAGTESAFSCGDGLTPKDGVCAATGGKYGGKGTAPVGGFPANPWGLHDLHGNVWEWVKDWYEEYYYFDSPPADPPGPAHGALKVARGGCWNSPPADCRSAARRSLGPDARSENVGFRVVMMVG